MTKGKSLLVWHTLLLSLHRVALDFNNSSEGVGQNLVITEFNKARQEERGNLTFFLHDVIEAYRHDLVEIVGLILPNLIARLVIKA